MTFWKSPQSDLQEGCCGTEQRASPDRVLTSRRALVAQHQAKIDEAIQQAKDLRKALKVGNLFAADLVQGSTLGSTIFHQLGTGGKGNVSCGDSSLQLAP